MGTPRDHALISPSSYERWSHCTAAPRYEEQFPEGEAGDYALEGTLAHSVCELYGRKKFTPMSTRKFKVRKMSPSARKAYERGRELFLMHAKSSMSIQEIAQKEHVSRQNIHRLINRFKVYYFDEYCFDKVVTEHPKEENHEQ